MDDSGRQEADPILTSEESRESQQYSEQSRSGGATHPPITSAAHIDNRLKRRQKYLDLADASGLVIHGGVDHLVDCDSTEEGVVVAAFGIGQLSRAMRSARPSLLAVAAMAPVSLLVLQLWSTTPSVTSPHGSTPFGTATLARPVVFLAAWMLMTAAMMLPSAMPLLVSLDRIARNQPGRHQIPIVAALAYLGIWGLVGIAAWITSAVSEAYILPRASTQVVSGLAGACLVLAGLYGLSPLASACLRACRRPFGFLARYWRGGARARLQACRIGAAYGVSCVGCCVPMLGIMFVAGMTNVATMIAMGGLMVIMKSSIVGTRVAHLLAIALIGTGVAVGLAWFPLLPHHH